MKLTTPATVGITGVGSYLPARTLTDHDVDERLAAAGLSTPPGLIRHITGIESRRLMADDEQASTLAVRAATDLLEHHNVDRADIDLLIFASASQDFVEPATAHVVQHELSISGHCFDVTNACNSFLNGIDVARSMVAMGRARKALVVTGESPSRAVRWQVKSLAEFRESFAGYTFGDAGAAVLIEPVEQGGILDIAAQAHSEHWKIGGLSGGGSVHPRGDEWTYFRGDGDKLRGAFEQLGPELVTQLQEGHSLTWDDLTYVLVHQVTVSYLDRFIEFTGIPSHLVVRTVGHYGNLASATLGVQLAEIYDKLTTGNRVLMIGLGGGISVSTMLWEKS